MVFGSAAGKEKHMNAMLTNITKNRYTNNNNKIDGSFFSQSFIHFAYIFVHSTLH